MMALVTGGASSGKSAFAEALACALGGDLVYLATMRPFGEEGARRIERHRAQRSGKGFDTVECFGSLEGAFPPGRLDGATVLLEDLGNLVANGLFGMRRERARTRKPGRGEGPSRGGDSRLHGAAETGAAEDDRRFPGARSARGEVEALAKRAGNLVVVGNEVGYDGCAYEPETRLYQEALGRAACEVAAMSDLVVECVAGVPVAVKVPADGGLPAGSAWARAVEACGGRL